MDTCRYKYSTGELCSEFSSSGFCNRHKQTYQSRNFKKIITVGQMTLMLYDNEAVFAINGTKIVPLGKKEIMFLENKGIKVKDDIKNLIFQKDEKEESIGGSFIDL